MHIVDKGDGKTAKGLRRESPRPGVLVLLALLASPLPALATTYEVGPGLPNETIGDVPWESLQAGDTVLIHWRAMPYREKWVIARQGTAAAPITVRGVSGPAGELPIIDGAGATTRLALDYPSETRGVIKIGSSSIPPDTMPRYIVIEGLDIRGARSPSTFTDGSGAMQTYQTNASAIYVERGENIIVRGCAIHDSGNGFFVASSDTVVSRNITVESNDIYDNGNVGSIFEHNSYTAAIGITFQGNHFGPLKAGAGGNNLKDRSAGLVVRYNWFEGGNRQLDLVNGEDSIQIRNDSSYHATHVYGNILIEPDGAGNRQIVHYGGDTGSNNGWRKGTLYFYNNTVVSKTARSHDLVPALFQRRALRRPQQHRVRQYGRRQHFVPSRPARRLDRRLAERVSVGEAGALATRVHPPAGRTRVRR